MTAASMSGCTNYTKMLNEQPAEYISMARENTAKAIAASGFGEEYGILSEACEDGSFKLDFEIEGVQFSGELYVSKRDEKSAQIYKLTGTEGTSAELYLYTGKDGMKFGTNGNSGRHVYDLTVDGFAEKLAASVFAPESGTDYAMSQEDYDAFVKVMEKFSTAAESTEPDKLTAMFEEYAEEHPPVTEEKVETDIGGETVIANTVTYSFTKEDIMSVTEQFVDIWLNEYASDEEFEYYTREETKEQIMSVFDEIDGCELKAVYCVNGKSHALMTSDVEMLITIGEESMNFYANALYGADPENSGTQIYTAGISSGDEEYSVKAVTTGTENGSSTAVTVSANGEESEFAEFSANRDGENYTLTLEIPEEEISCKAEGTVKTDKKSFEITLDRVSAVSGSAEVSYLPKGVVRAEKGGAMPELDADKEFLDITVEELDTLLENIEDDFTAVLKETSMGGTMLDYIDKSKLSQANANAKTAHVAATAALVREYVNNGRSFPGSEISGNGTEFSFGGEETDLADFLGESFSGYVYGEFDGEECVLEYMLWSAEPIPDGKKKLLSSDEQQELAEQGTYIGCYPVQY
ncbi:MAG: hypothetical protein NC395_01785 [Prevotella sp.]|nr:hypothetical protein [Prevotella sp.]